MPFFSPKGEPLHNPYTLLNLEHGATDDEIAKSFKKLMLQLHPDKQTADQSPEEKEEISQKFHNVMDAKSFLLDGEHLAARRVYDSKLIRVKQAATLSSAFGAAAGGGSEPPASTTSAHTSAPSNTSAAAAQTSSSSASATKSTVSTGSSNSARTKKSTNSYPGSLKKSSGEGSSKTNPTKTKPEKEKPSSYAKKNVNVKQWGKVKRPTKARPVANSRRAATSSDNHASGNNNNKGTLNSNKSKGGTTNTTDEDPMKNKIHTRAAAKKSNKFDDSCGDCSTTDDCNSYSDDEANSGGNKYRRHTYSSNSTSHVPRPPSSNRPSALKQQQQQQANNNSKSSFLPKGGNGVKRNTSRQSSSSSAKVRPVRVEPSSDDKVKSAAPPQRSRSDIGTEDIRPTRASADPSSHHQRSKSDFVRVDELIRPGVPQRSNSDDGTADRSRAELASKRRSSLDSKMFHEQQQYRPQVVPEDHNSAEVHDKKEQQNQQQQQASNNTSDFSGFFPAIELLQKQYHCPLTKSIMIEPMTDLEGNSYEREAILKYLETNCVSPVTGSPLYAEHLSLNTALREKIRYTLKLKDCLDTLQREKQVAQPQVPQSPPSSPRPVQQPPPSRFEEDEAFSKQQQHQCTAPTTPLSLREEVDNFIKDFNSGSPAITIKHLDPITHSTSFSYIGLKFKLEVPEGVNDNIILQTWYDHSKKAAGISSRVVSFNATMQRMGLGGRLTYRKINGMYSFTLTKGYGNGSSVGEKKFTNKDMRYTIEYFTEMAIKLHNVINPGDVKQVGKVRLTNSQ